MDDEVSTKTEEGIDVYQFVIDYIRKELYFTEVEYFEAIGDDNTMWLETTDADTGEVTHGEYKCIHPKCMFNNRAGKRTGSTIGEEEIDVFTHIRDEHPSVTGLIIEKPTEDEEYEDV